MPSAPLTLKRRRRVSAAQAEDAPPRPLRVIRVAFSTVFPRARSPFASKAPIPSVIAIPFAGFTTCEIPGIAVTLNLLHEYVVHPFDGFGFASRAQNGRMRKRTE